jgi:hypothetical protein
VWTAAYPNRRSFRRAKVRGLVSRIRTWLLIMAIALSATLMSDFESIEIFGPGDYRARRAAYRHRS